MAEAEQQQPKRGIIETADLANNLVNRYVVAPYVGFGLAGFVFSIKESDEINLESDITDHYVEDNSAVQDHIALKPIRIKLRGYVGELVVSKEAERNKLQEFGEKLTQISGYVSTITDTAKQLKSVANQNLKTTTDYLDAGIKGGKSIYDAYKTLNPPDTEQARAFNFFESLWKGRMIVSLETPFKYYPSLAIETITAIQKNEMITDFSVTLKEWRAVETQLVEFNEEKYQGRLQGQVSEVQNNGKAQGVKKEFSSFSYKVLFGG